jgi:hypothetical protein
MYGKGPVVTLGAAGALFAATDVRAIGVVFAIVAGCAGCALVLRRLVLRRTRG